VRRGRVAAAAALVLGAAGAAAFPLWGPPVLREVPWFAAVRIEVAGTRLLAPDEAVALSGVRIGDNVWTEPDAWVAALKAHPVVEDAAVERRLPGTLRIRIREKRPVALVRAGTLRPATAAGEVLPVDPVRAPLDLPVLAGALPDTATRVADAAMRTLLAEAGRLAALDPALLARVSELHPDAGGARLVLSAPRADVVLPAGAEDVRLTYVRAVLADLEPRMADLPGRARVDARFADQVVVRLPARGPAPRP
jgi:cell division septal protein FtsQ